MRYTRFECGSHTSLRFNATSIDKPFIIETIETRSVQENCQSFHTRKFASSEGFNQPYPVSVQFPPSTQNRWQHSSCGSTDQKDLGKKWGVWFRIVQSFLHWRCDRFWRIGRVQFRLHQGSRFGSGNQKNVSSQHWELKLWLWRDKAEATILDFGFRNSFTTGAQALLGCHQASIIQAPRHKEGFAYGTWCFFAVLLKDTKKGITLRTELDIDTASHTAQDCTCGSWLSGSCGDIPCKYFELRVISRWTSERWWLSTSSSALVSVEMLNCKVYLGQCPGSLRGSHISDHIFWHPHPNFWCWYCRQCAHIVGLVLACCFQRYIKNWWCLVIFFEVGIKI